MIGTFDGLDAFGAIPDNLVYFSDPHPAILAYSTILMARERDDDLHLVEAVYEWQGEPLVFLVDDDRLKGDLERLTRIRRILAMRGDAPYLGIVAPGRLDIYVIGLDGQPPKKVRVDTNVTVDDKSLTFARLGNLRPAAGINDKTWITGVILKLLSEAISSLKSRCELSAEDAISLVGRALFMRFLADRNLLPSTKEIVGGEQAPAVHELFDNPTSVKLSCIWLDRTFNGELLPLSEGVFANLNESGCGVLGNILRRGDGAQLFLGWQERWDHLDFSHIPVGVLSQAYENYLKKHSPGQQRKEGGFYTPHPIANLMMSAAFRGLEAKGNSAEARILDPAAGAGVFLLAGFRELVYARWRVDGIRPDTAVLREILYTQVRGFDINEAALRFCALGLYLLSIELDPDPKPVDKLHFDDLRNVVLFRPIDTTSHDRPETKQLGSLGSMIGEEHHGQYDLVIGNPPWASATRLDDWDQLLVSIHELAKERLGLDAAAPRIPNEALDLPFVWKAMSWAKPDAQIVFALHARFLFHQTDGMRRARQSILEAIDVTSIINGAELRKTKVWPNTTQPFCLIFASNRPAHMASGFRLISPRYEDGFNKAGMLRVDAANAYVVRPLDLRERPDTLKVLFRGSEADITLIDRVRRGPFTTFGTYLTMSELAHGKGYKNLGNTSRQNPDGTLGADAHFLRGKPHLDDVENAGLVIDSKTLPAFKKARLDRVRDPNIYRGPLLLIHESPPANTQRIRASVCDDDVVFNQSWHGFSARGKEDGEALVRYLALLLGSRFVMWVSLITSGKFGVERDILEKSILEELIIPSFEKLDMENKRTARVLFAKLEVGGESVWPEVDQWVASLYNFNERDLIVINDTLRFNLPYAANQRLAQTAPSIDEIEHYRQTLQDELSIFARRFRCQVRVKVIDERQKSPWRSLRVSIVRDSRTDDIESVADIRALTTLADRANATEIVVSLGNQSLAVMLLAQARYWCTTHARLAAQRIIWTHLKLFKEASE